MAAAALLRSMARKLVRAPPLPPRPLLAAGLHGGATAGLRSGAAALPSFATKIARTPSQAQPHHRHILNRRLHSGSTLPPATDKDKIIEHLRRDLWHAKFVIGIGYLVLGFGFFWFKPKLEKMRNRSVAFERLMDIIIRADEDEHCRAALAQIIQIAGHMKQQSNGTTEKGTKVDNLQEEDVMAIYFDVLKGRLDELRADIKEFQVATAMSRSAPLEQKEG